MAAYQTVTLTGTYQTPNRTAHKGHVEIIPSERVIKDTTGDIILTGRVKVDLIEKTWQSVDPDTGDPLFDGNGDPVMESGGFFSVALPATDDPTLNPTGFGYTIAAKLHSSHPPAVSFSLPASLGATTVEDLTPVDPSTFAPTTTYAESSEVAALDSRVTTVETTKADSADLATVATTGNYGDLTSLPTIPSTAADVGALPDTTVIPSTPAEVGAEPAGLSTTTQNTLAGTYAPVGHKDYTGSAPLLEYAALSSGTLLHLLAGDGSTAPYLLGLGVDHDNSPTGLVASVKGNNSIGMATTLETTSGPNAKGFIGQNLSSGELIRLIAGSAATGALLTLNNIYGGTGKLLNWDTAVTDGQIGSDGNVTMTGSAAYLAVQHAATNQNQIKMSVATAATALTMYQYAGGGVHFPSVIATNSSSLRIRKGGAAAMGAETLTTLLEFKDTNAIGFFGATPATPAQRTLPAAGAVTAADIRALLITIGLAQ